MNNRGDDRWRQEILSRDRRVSLSSHPVYIVKMLFFVDQVPRRLQKRIHQPMRPQQ
jgi:hypothetical protein